MLIAIFYISKTLNKERQILLLPGGSHVYVRTETVDKWDLDEAEQEASPQSDEYLLGVRPL